MLKSTLLAGAAVALAWTIPATVSANDATGAQAVGQSGYHAQFDSVDANNDGMISRSEWNQHFASGAQSRDPQASELQERDRGAAAAPESGPGSQITEHPGNTLQDRPAGSPMPGGSEVKPSEPTLNENQ